MAAIEMPQPEPWPPAAMAPRPPTTANNGSAKRPSRKSTLTQQQKNQKRQRATQDQLITLELEFNNNPTPTSTVRERIAQEINMTERSVQIWFQNRRAKIKLLAKKSIETGEECDAIPESMRQYLALQALESGKGLARNGSHRGSTAGSSNASRSELLLAAEPAQTSKVVIHHFACRALTVGSWRRVGLNAMDLVIFYSPDKACVTYYINNDSAGYKIEYPFSSIKNITLDPGDGAPAAQPGQPSPGGLVIELMQPPNFFMDSSGSGGFYQCGDFTEDQQASRVLVHHLGGHPKVLSGQLAKLVSLEVFRNRHGVAPPAAPAPAVAVSAPVSPGLHRPASQPNYLSHPNMAPSLEAAYGQHLHPGRGHKRQRSRSVPVAVDMLALQQHAMPAAFQFAPDAPMTASPHNTFYTQLPLHQPVPNGTAAAPNLRIDTSTGFGMDYRTYPLSAATTISPSEYAVSPSLFPATTATPPVKAAVATATPDQMQATFYQASYSLPFLSPRQDANGFVDASGSPLSGVSPRDPVIANQSPPLISMDRCPSVDLFSFPGDVGSLGDDSMGLAELYSKQSLNLTLPSPEIEPGDDLAMQNMISFEAIEPSVSDSQC